MKIRGSALGRTRGGKASARGTAFDGARDAGDPESLSAAFVALYEPRDVGELPSPTVRAAIADQFNRLYYHDADRTWKRTWYRGVPTQKCPTDMWIYQEIIHTVRPDVVIETGTAYGGSALFMADFMETIGCGRVVSVDILDMPDRPSHPRIEYVLGSSVDPRIVDTVAERIGGADRVMVILDSCHSEEHVAAELDAYAAFVTPRSYLIVEDTNVAGHPVFPLHPAGPMEALRAFLPRHPEFEVDPDCERFYATFNPSGYLRRVNAVG